MSGIDRRRRMLGACDPARSRGLEIGALTSPLVRRTEGDIQYVDYATTDVVRANQHHPSVVLEDIVDVDIVWGERPLAETIAAPVDYIVASHVIEHIPDLIGWLGELHAALRPGGTLGLAIPDRRFTFDARRNESQLAEMVEAYLLRYRRPSIRQVFDVCALSMDVDAAEAWQRDVRDGAAAPGLLQKLPEAFALARSLIDNPRYVDAHCWVFTPQAFLDAAQWLATLDLFPYTIEGFYPTEAGTAEFFVRLSAAPPGARAMIEETVRAARLVLAAAPSEAAYRAAMIPAPAIQPAVAPSADVERAEARIRGLETEVAELRRVVNVLHASTSWRMTAPLRALATRMQTRR